MKLKPSLVLCAFILQACGGGGSGNQAPPPNRAPAASDQSTATNPGTILSGVLSATDPDGDALTISVVANPASGSVILSGSGNRDFDYTPNPGFAGADSFTFSASDGALTSNTATVSITVNNQPVAVGSNFETSDLSDLSGNVSSTDVEVDAVTFSVTAQPAKGAITSFDAATGAFTYSPDPDEDGLDSFSFVASDPFQSSAEATVNVEIFGWPGPIQFGSIAADGPTTGGLLIGADGGLILGGRTKGSLNGTPNAGGWDAWLGKIGRRGAELWTTHFGSMVDDVARNLWLNPQGAGFYAVTQTFGTFVRRFDDDGIELWNAQIDFGSIFIVNGANAYWSNMDAAGNIYLLSWTHFGSNEIGSVVTKIDGTNGNVLWHRELIPSQADPVAAFLPESLQVYARGIDFDSAGRLVVSGSFAAGAGSARTCFRCPFLASFDADGNTLWVREPDSFVSCGRSGDGQFFRASVAADDTIYVAGISERVFVDSSDGVVARFSADGSQELWSYCDASGDANSWLFTQPLLRANGNILVYGTLEAPPDPITNIRESADLLLFEFDAAGNLILNRTIGASRADGTAARVEAGSIAEDSQGVLYLSGTTDGELTSSPNAGLFDIFILRLRSDGTSE